MNLKNFKITNKGLYWGLIVTFALLYLCVGFVSTLHSITFFNLANTVGLAVLLGITYEIGQASVLFSILMTKNKDKFLPWALMFLLTALQVTANVYASFKFMATSGSNDWQYWQKSILIGVQAENAEMYQVIISWIAGALLPIVALGMTALVANNIKMITEENEANNEEPKEENKPREEELKEENKPKKTSDLSETIGKILDRDNHLEKLKNTLLSTAGPATKYEENPIIGEGGVEIIKDPISIELRDHEKANEEFEKEYFQDNMTPLQRSEKELQEIIENEVERRLREKESARGINSAFDVQEGMDYLDREANSLIPETTSKIIDAHPSQIIIPEENLPEVSNEIEDVTSPEIMEQAVEATIKEAEESRITEEKTPVTKTRGWHLKKTYVDSNGDVYHFGKISDDKELKEPQDSKKA
ncbi:MAG TPA: hypothetical protein PK122_00450 [Candidatus Paceibacterota bacterium]|nr:hypothetical protein [Candidatus Paceibacterota bacterium]